MLATNALACHESEKGNAPEELPLESDIKIFKYITTEITSLITKKIQNETLTDIKLT